MKKQLLIIMVLLMSLRIVYGAMLIGNIYDEYLYPIDRAVIKINTSPEQVIVVNNSGYNIDLNKGVYRVEIYLPTSNGLVLIHNETIIINDDSKYLHDFIMSIDIESNDIDELKEIEESNNKLMSIALIITIIILAGIGMWLLKKKSNENVEKKTKSNEKERIIEILKRNDKRMTQKELAKELDVSKSKLSLILVEMEQEGLIKKYKKGRGNIIVLK